MYPDTGIKWTSEARRGTYGGRGRDGDEWGREGKEKGKGGIEGQGVGDNRCTHAS